MAYGQNMKAPSSGIASLMAMRGRKGDNTLVHVNPMELRALNSMAPGGLCHRTLPQDCPKHLN